MPRKSRTRCLKQIKRASAQHGAHTMRACVDPVCGKHQSNDVAAMALRMQKEKS
jgi:hypothetical protein